MARDKSTDDMYREMMESAATFGHLGGRKPTDPDDMEDFITSKEVVEQNIKVESDGTLSTLPKRPEQIEETVHFKTYSQRRVHKYTQSEMEKIRASCEATIVHDYGEFDYYHMTDEERINNDVLAELSMKLGTLKRTYNQVDQYIEAMRIVVQAWAILEKHNYVHSRDEFYRLVSEGKIVSSRILMPKLRGIGRYNMDLIIKYVSNPDADPHDLVPKPVVPDTRWTDRRARDFSEDEEYITLFGEVTARMESEYKEAHPDEPDYDITDDLKALEKAEQEVLDMMELRQMHRLLSEEEAENLNRYKENTPEIRVHEISRKLVKGYDDHYTRYRRKNGKKDKKLSKKKRFERDMVHGLLGKIQDATRNSSRSSYATFQVTSSIFDMEKPETNPYDEIRYEGSWADKHGVRLFDIAVREAMLQRTIPGNVYRTYANQELIDFFQALEDGNVSTLELRRRMNQTDETISSAEAKQKKKEDKKIEAALVQRITKLNKSNKFRKTVSKAEKDMQREAEDS